VVLDRGAWSLRFALPSGLSPDPLDAARENALVAMSAGLRNLGLNEVEVALPDARSMLDSFAQLQMAEALDVHVNVLGTYPSQSEAYGADVRARLELAQAVTIAQYLEARRGQDATKTAFARAFQFADVLVSPVGPTGASSTDTPDVVSMAGGNVPLRQAMMPYTIPQNLAGLPSITCPVGVDDAGLPIGIQLTGAPWSEPMLLSLAFALERDGVACVSTAPTVSNLAHTPEGRI
jgi:aspartyl-tRNA(Asn)/glutamyl-tRNA(Gln) amidotransferase subunit A